jgi:hypothetical protein
MSYGTLYNRIIEKETIVPKSKLEARRVYKIVSYEYVGGKLTSFSGPESAIIFLISITPDKILHCIKISEARPNKFFDWLKLNLKRGLKYDAIREIAEKNTLDELLPADNRTGSKTFMNLKRHGIYEHQPGTYRTYLLNNVKSIKEVKFNTDDFLKFLKIQKPTQLPSKSENP